MNYEKKYKEAQKWIESIYSELSHEQQMEAEAFFPELKESEDEKIRKRIIHALHGDVLDMEETNKAIAWLEKQGTPQDKGEISDGYHTFNELYYYRMLYNAAFFNMLPKEWVHKSKKHHDGEDCFGGGWFIVMANLPTGQISNHYELKNWDLFQIPEKEVADKWDGHTPQEAADRLHKYLLEKQGEQKVPIVDFNAKDWYVSKVDGKIHNTKFMESSENQGEQKSQRMVSAETKEAMYDKPTDNDMVEALRTEYEKGRADVLRCIDPDVMVADFCSQPLSKTRSLASIYRQGIIDIVKRINNNEETSITSTRSIDDGGV